MTANSIDSPLSKDEEKDENDDDTSCGIGNWRPAVCQKFANMRAFTGINSGVTLIMSTLAAYMSSQVPTLEKQFGMSSYETGLLMSFNDIGFLSCCLFLTSLARYVHIPRFLFVCGICFGISGILCTLPHFLTPTDIYMTPLYQGNGSSSSENISYSSNIPVCVKNQINISTISENDVCLDSDVSKGFMQVGGKQNIKKMALGMIAFGMFVQGVGKAPRSSFLTVYVDDNTDKRKTGFFMGITSCAAIMGMALAFGLGGVFSTIYVTLEDVDISRRDPRWIGAWWLGFMAFGVASIVTVVPLSCFPRRMKRSTKEIIKNREYGSVEELPVTLKGKVKDRLLSYYRVLRNTLYLYTLISSLAQYIAIVGYFAFLVKYISAQWGITLWRANFILSVTNLVSLAVGAFLGGLMTRKIAMTPRNTYGWMAVLLIIHTIIFALGFFIGCDQPYFVGPKSAHGDYALSTDCSDGCGCEHDNFFPICGSNGINYHSPCFAGCSVPEKGGSIFSNCTCIPDGMATAGQCSLSECTTLYPWSGINFAASLIAAIVFMISFVAKIRCVKDKDKSTATGLEAFLAAIIAFVPVPIVFGKIVDTCCLIWQSSCSSRGACLFYDNFDYRIKIHVFTCAFKVIAIIFTLLALWKTWRWSKWRDSTKNENAHAHDLSIKIQTDNSYKK